MYRAVLLPPCQINSNRCPPIFWLKFFWALRLPNTLNYTCQNIKSKCGERETTQKKHKPAKVILLVLPNNKSMKLHKRVVVNMEYQVFSAPCKRKGSTN